MKVDVDALVQAAIEARERAYSPYSRFAVGAALLTASGEVFTGSNVENAVYSLTVCAERAAVFQAVTAGYRDFVALAVVANTPGPVFPCGACRQVMLEFNPAMQVIMANLRGEIYSTTVAELLPGAFTATDLNSATVD